MPIDFHRLELTNVFDLSSDTKSISDIRDSYVVVCGLIGDISKILESPDLNGTAGRYIDLYAKKNIDASIEEFGKHAKHVTGNSEGKKKGLLYFLLPSLPVSDKAKEFFGRVRSQLLNTNSHVSLVLLGDAVTWRAASRMLIEAESPLGKEFGDQLWVIERPGPQVPIIDWLTGGDCHLIEFFEKNKINKGETHYKDLNEIRNICHKLVGELLNPNGYYYLLKRLQLEAEPDSKRADKERELLYGLSALLPGTFGAEDSGARADWFRLRRYANWQRYSMLDWRLQYLLLAGLVRYGQDGDHAWLRLRSPLVAFAVSRLLMLQGIWNPGNSAMRDPLISQFHADSRAGSDPDGLDRYLDIYLAKSLSDEGADKEQDHWTTVALPKEMQSKSSSGKKDGEWWTVIKNHKNYRSLPKNKSDMGPGEKHE